MLEFFELARQCAPSVAPETMAALVKTESAFQALAIGINGGGRLERQPQSSSEAVATAKSLLDKGFNIDLGLGQINSRNLARTGLTIEDAFDPCKNLAAAAQILTGNFLAARPASSDPQRALHAAVSAYNTGSPTRGFANGYVQRVLLNAPSYAGLPPPVSLAGKIIDPHLSAGASPNQPGQPAAINPLRLLPLGAKSEILKLKTLKTASDLLDVGRDLDVGVYQQNSDNISVYR